MTVAYDSHMSYTVHIISPCNSQISCSFFLSIADVVLPKGGVRSEKKLLSRLEQQWKMVYLLIRFGRIIKVQRTEQMGKQSMYDCLISF